MKAIAYNISNSAKEALILANHKKHEITFISQELSEQTAGLAIGKEVLLVFPGNNVSAPLIPLLQASGIKYLACAVPDIDNIDRKAAGKFGLKISNVPASVVIEDTDLEGSVTAMQQVIRNLDLWAAGKCVGKACCCMNDCAKKNPVTTSL